MPYAVTLPLEAEAAAWMRQMWCALGVQSRGVVVRSLVTRRTPFGSRSSRLSPNDAASSSQTPSGASVDPRPRRPIRPEP